MRLASVSRIWKLRSCEPMFGKDNTTPAKVRHGSVSFVRWPYSAGEWMSAAGVPNDVRRTGAPFGGPAMSTTATRLEHDLLRVHCVEGITANPEVCRHYVEYSIGTVTALNLVIGYERATELAAEAMKTGRGIMELVREKKVLSEQQIAEVLDPLTMTGQARRG
jgi:hypothetical protein